MGPEPEPNRARAIAEAESRRLWRLAAMGGTLASEILAGALIGWLLDLVFKTKPTLLVVFTVAGVVVGMTTFLRSALAAERRSTRDATRIATDLRHEHPDEARPARPTRSVPGQEGPPGAGGEDDG